MGFSNDDSEKRYLSRDQRKLLAFVQDILIDNGVIDKDKENLDSIRVIDEDGYILFETDQP